MSKLLPVIEYLPLKIIHSQRAARVRETKQYPFELQITRHLSPPANDCKKDAKIKEFPYLLLVALRTAAGDI